MVITIQPVLVKSTVVASAGLEAKATSAIRLELAQHMRICHHSFHIATLGGILIV